MVGYFKFAEKNELFLIAESNSIDAYVRFVPDGKKGDIWELAFHNVEALEAILYFYAKRFVKREITTSALISENLFKTNKMQSIKTEYESSNIVMYKNLAISRENIFTNHSNYCFWWTDNF